MSRAGGKQSLRVYFIEHDDGKKTGLLLRAWAQLFDAPPPAAFGTSTDDVYQELESQLAFALASGKETIDRYLWEESFETREVKVTIHPWTTIKTRSDGGAATGKS